MHLKAAPPFLPHFDPPGGIYNILRGIHFSHFEFPDLPSNHNSDSGKTPPTMDNSVAPVP